MKSEILFAYIPVHHLPVRSLFSIRNVTQARVTLIQWMDPILEARRPLSRAWGGFLSGQENEGQEDEATSALRPTQPGHHSQVVG